MAIVPLGPWLPDTAAIGNAGLAVATNVLPRTDRSYGPMAGLGAYSDAMPARAQGAYSIADADGLVNVFAGDAGTLQRLTNASGNFEDVSKAGGYTTPADGRWSFSQFGQRVIATNFTEPVQSYTLGSSTDFADLGGSPPKARYVAVAKSFVLLANTDDGASVVPNRVRWSAIGDPADYPVIGSADAAAKQSDQQDLEGDGGWIQGIVGNLGTADAAVLQERAVWRMTYIGPPAVFQFDAAEGVRGTPAPGSIAQLGAYVFYLGEDGFYAFDGTNSTPIGGEKVDKTFFAELNQANFHRISSAVDPINKIVLWSYPTTASASGTPDRILAYNWSLGRWSRIEIEHEMIFRATSLGYSLDSLDNYSTDLDALPFSLDSRAWTGGRLILAGFDTSHRMGFFNAANLAATIETGDIVGNGGERFFVNGIRPIVDGGTVTGAIGHRAAPGDSLTYTTATAAGSDGRCPQRINTRFARARISVAAGGSWSHISGVEMSAQARGRR